MIEFLIGACIVAILLYVFKTKIKKTVNKYFIAKLIACATSLLCTAIVIFFAFFGFGEIFSGDFSGISHIIAAIPFCVIVYVLAIALNKLPKGKKHK
ncbi:MAG: hypothetical protein PVI21_02230 [Candidatus Woesebacteria bacterium]|jgi:hypothetical protein